MVKGGFDRVDIVKNETTRLWDVTVDFLGKRTRVGSYGFLDDAIENHNRAKKNAKKAAKEEAARAETAQKSLQITATPKTLKRNSSNKSGTVGVCFDNTRKKWRAVIKIDQKQIALGFYVEKDDAIAARLAANVKYGFLPKSATGAN